MDRIPRAGIVWACLFLLWLVGYVCMVQGLYVVAVPLGILLTGIAMYKLIYS